MLASLLNAIRAHSEDAALELPLGNDTATSPVSGIVHGLDSLHLTDNFSIPGAFSGPSTTNEHPALKDNIAVSIESIYYLNHPDNGIREYR